MTELIWDGKYKYPAAGGTGGKKVAPVRIALPFQTIETVNESAEDRRRTLDMFAQGKPTEWRNRLIWGDKKYVLPSLLPEFAGKVNLIYIDPPFDTGADFSFTATIPGNPETEQDETTEFVKEPSILEQKAYRDTWGRGLDSYLQWFYETVVLLRELLAEDGSIYVHLDWHVSHYCKSIMDEVFGYENFRNEIIWQRTTNTGSSKSIAKKLSNDTDSMLYYGKSGSIVFNKLFRDYGETYLDRFKYKDERGYYRWSALKTYSDETYKRLESEGRIRWGKNAKYPEFKQYKEDLKGVPLNNLWADIFHVNPMALEKVAYATQKPEELIERVSSISSNENDLVLDCFGGSGTTAAVAEKNNRRWIVCDLGRFAIHTTRKRLLQIPNVKPFVVQNLGKYERQAWQESEFTLTPALSQGERESVAVKEQAYRNFILDLYNAEPFKGYVWLHGIKDKRMVHVGAVDSPVALGDVKAIIQEFWKSVGKSFPSPEAGEGLRERVNGVDILGWEFAFDINETARQQAAASNVDVKFKKIPREVLDKKAVEQGDVHFYELAGLDVKTKVSGKKIELTLKEFVIPPDDVPEDVRSAIKHWSQWIDYWAVDWNYRDDTFHNEWQAYRTKKNPTIELATTHEYEEEGTYAIVVKVIDILGNDTTKAVEVVVKWG
ncbi:MAG: site-specific DNA-methyltransferase [Ignavibacteriae bacterium]|nr:site-specific DNA-methyltransferase [Ignavibacteriota bacterium]